MRDLFVGRWELDVEKSQFAANHGPTEATMVFELEAEGHYLLKAEGKNAKGETVAERPTRLVADGKDYPVPDFPGLRIIATQPQPNTITSEVRKEDGSVIGGGTYEVSVDGRLLTATTFGWDAQLRRFQQHSVWTRRQG
jgi:hypothetical protein